MPVHTRVKPEISGSTGSAYPYPQLSACKQSMQSKAPLGLGGALLALSRDGHGHVVAIESSLDLERATKRKAKGRKLWESPRHTKTLKWG